MNVLVVVAHPDDDILGMGGTILKHSEKGDKVKILYMATGITSRRSSNYENALTYDFDEKELQMMEKEIEKLRENTRKASKILKVKDILFFDFPDNEMDSVPLLKIIKTIENVIYDFKPDIVYTTHYGDLNVDHRIVYEACLTACRPIAHDVKELISFEVASSTEWNYPSKFNPNYFVDINKQLGKKLKAMSMFENELRTFPHPRSLENLKMIAGRWGSVSGTKAAEAFEIIRKIDRNPKLNTK